MPLHRQYKAKLNTIIHIIFIFFLMRDLFTLLVTDGFSLKSV